MSERVLFVDDEPAVLAAFERQLYGQFEIATAVGATRGLEILAAADPFAVIVSDMRMPGMNGIEFLTQVKQGSPQSVRMMLTGCADQETAIEAINEGNIFRFLTKPCSPELLTRALTAGIEQYRLITAEKDLLEKTLRGAIKVVTEVLSLASPVAFSHALRVQRLVRKLCREMSVERIWPVEIAAMLSQIGCVTVPLDTLEKVYCGHPLDPQEAHMLDAHPRIGCELVGHIPRLEEVSRIIAYQQKGFDGSGNPPDSIAGEEIPLGARILKLALDFEMLTRGGRSGRRAMTILRERARLYDAHALAALEEVLDTEESFEVQEMELNQLTLNTVLAEDVRTPDGILVVGKGQEVTLSLYRRLKNFARNRRLENQIRVRVFVQRTVSEDLAK